MSDQNNKELHDRLRRLEQRVEELEQQLDRRHKSDPGSQISSTGEQASEQEKQKTPGLFPEQVQFGEHWLNRIGIALLLIGVAFLFKYSIDQGWLIPAVRSAIGLGIGAFLFGSGIRMDETMNPFRQILLGGGIAVFYITGFATYQLYEFMPGVVTWLFMIVVTLLALSLSLQQDEPILSVTGILGALGTPFMLYSGSGSVVMLMLYSALVLGAGAIIYFQKGWKSLLWSLLVGGAGVLAVGIVTTSFYGESTSQTELWMLQFGIVVWALATWGIATVRQLSAGTSDPGPTVHLSIFVVPLWMLPLMAINWELSTESAGIISLALAILGAAGYLLLSRKKLSRLAFSHGLMGLLMATVGFILFFEGTVLYVILAVEAVALRYIATQTGDSKLDFSAHLLFLMVLIWTFNTLRYSVDPEAPLLTVDGISQLAFIIAGGTVIPVWLQQSDRKQIYRLVAHLMLLFWIYQTFSGLSNGQAWVTILWGLYAIGLLVAGFTKYGKEIRLTGMATLFLVIGKLFWVDLAQLQAIWRILLFIGFGSALMLLGYYLQSAWSDTESET